MDKDHYHVYGYAGLNDTRLVFSVVTCEQELLKSMSQSLLSAVPIVGLPPIHNSQRRFQFSLYIENSLRLCLSITWT